MGDLPPMFGFVHPRTRTPVFATGVIGVAVLVLALFVPLINLAETTSIILMIVFVSCNIALIRIKQRAPAPFGRRIYPMWVPVCGALISGGMLGFAVLRRFTE
jgi:amino acid transporter